MNVKSLSPVVSIVAGICVLVFPNLLIWVVGIFLIVNGVMALTHRG